MEIEVLGTRGIDWRVDVSRKYFWLCWSHKSLHKARVRQRFFFFLENCLQPPSTSPRSTDRSSNMRPTLSFAVSTCVILTAMTCGVRVQQLARGGYGDDDDPKWIRLCTLISNGNSSQLNISMPCRIRIEDESDDNQGELVDDDIVRDDHEVMVNVGRPTGRWYRYARPDLTKQIDFD